MFVPPANGVFDSTNGIDDQGANNTRTQPTGYGGYPLTNIEVNSDGSVTRSLEMGRYTFPNSTGYMVVADNEFTGYATADPTTSLLSVSMTPSSTSEPNIQFNYTGYQYNQGLYDYTGAALDMTLLGLMDKMTVEGDAAPVVVTDFKTGTATGNYWADSWAFGTDLCDGDDCTTQTVDTEFRLQNGFGNLHQTSWALKTNSTASTLAYTLGMSDTGFVASHNINVFLIIDGAPVQLNAGEARTFTATAPGQVQSFEIRDADDVNAHPVNSYLPLILGNGPDYAKTNESCPSAYTANGTAAAACTLATQTAPFNGYVPTTNRISLSSTGVLMIESEVDATWLANPGQDKHAGLTDITFDPAYFFGNNENDGSGTGVWKFGVDRDGCYAYDYPCAYSGESSKNEFGGDGGYNQDDDFFEYEGGDGWCEDTGTGWLFWTAAENALCKVSGLTSASTSMWNAQGMDSEKAFMPLMDTSPGFDGAVIEVTLDKSAFMAEQHSGGWDTHIIDIQLQEAGYKAVGSSSGNARGWTDTCWNGYLDVYMVPNTHWKALYGQAAKRANQFESDGFPHQNGANSVAQPATVGNGDGQLIDKWSGDYWRTGTQFSASGHDSNMDAYFYEAPNNPTSKELEYWTEVGALQPDSEMIMAINPYHGQSDYDTPDPGGSNWWGVWDRPDELDGSTFDQAWEYWDIDNIDPTSPYYQMSQTLGSQGPGDSDFCLNDQVQNADGESILPLDMSGTMLNVMDDMSLAQLMDAGYITSTGSNDIKFTLLLDPIGHGSSAGNQKEFCFFSYETSSSAGSNVNYNGGSVGSPKADIWDAVGNNDGTGRHAEACIWDTHNVHSSGNVGGSVAGDLGTNMFNDVFTVSNPCTNSIPTSTAENSAVHPNPDSGMWCAITLDTPWSRDENVKFKFTATDPASPLPEPEPATHNDQDGDGIFDDFDDCPTLAWYWNNGCPPATSPYIPPADDGDDRNADNDDADGNDPDHFNYPPQENCANPSTPDDGTNSYEDNDGDGLIDEDPFDEFDNDGDGLIDEDPIDDCPDDTVDLTFDKTFPGSVDMVIENAVETNGSIFWAYGIGSQFLAEDNSGRASGNANKVHNASFEDWQAISGSTASSAVLLERNSILIKHDAGKNANLRASCVGLMSNYENVNMRVNVQVFVPTNNALLQVSHDEAPFLGMWVDYGPVNFDGDTATDHSGWNTAFAPAVDNNPQSQSSGGGDGMGTRDAALKELHLGEGYYSVSCQGSVQQTVAGSGATVWSHATTYQQIMAVEICDNGDLPVPATPEGACVQGGGSGDGTSEGLSDLWTAITGSIFAISILGLAIAGALILWFIDRKKAAVAASIFGIGAALAFFSVSVEMESGTADLIGTLGHLTLAGSAFLLAFRTDGPSNPLSIATALLAIGIWGAIHAVGDYGEIEWLVPAMPGAAWVLVALGMTGALFAALVGLNVVEDPLGILED